MAWPWTRRRAHAPAETAPAPEQQPAAAAPMKISLSALAEAAPAAAGNGTFELTPITEAPRVDEPWAPAAPPPGLKVAAADQMAFDEATVPALRQMFEQFGEGLGFLGYAYLAELAQRPEYRNMAEGLANEMTREWIEFHAKGDKATRRRKAKQIRAIEEAFEQLRVRDAFRRAAELDGFFGRGQIYIDTGATDDVAELQTALILDKAKITKGSLKGLRVIEPMWTYPADYDATDPLKRNYYRPQAWLVMSKKVHHTRLLTVVAREVPDILKPAYSFGGLSLSQAAKPYVDNWLRTRQSVSDLLHSFTVFVLKTDMSTILSGGGADTVTNRAKLFNLLRDARGVMMLNKKNGADEGEDLENVSVPLGTLDKLQDQALEQMAFVAHQPLVKLFGTTPSGLNASSDGEIRVFYDYIAAMQERVFGSNLEALLKIVQLHLFGRIDPDIGFRFKPLWQASDTDEATTRKSESERDKNYVEAGVLAPVEVRAKLAADEESGYDDLDVEAVPEEPEDDEEDDQDDQHEPAEDKPGAADA